MTSGPGRTSGPAAAAPSASIVSLVFGSLDGRSARRTFPGLPPSLCIPPSVDTSPTRVGKGRSRDTGQTWARHGHLARGARRRGRDRVTSGGSATPAQVVRTTLPPSPPSRSPRSSAGALSTCSPARLRPPSRARSCLLRRAAGCCALTSAATKVPCRWSAVTSSSSPTTPDRRCTLGRADQADRRTLAPPRRSPRPRPRAIATAAAEERQQGRGHQLVVYALGGAAEARLGDHRRRRGRRGRQPATVDVDAHHAARCSTPRSTSSTAPAPAGSAARSRSTPRSPAARSRMKDPATTNLRCQDAANNTTFTGTDDVWGNGNATNRETGCVDALFAAQTEATMLSHVARPQRLQRHRRRLADPRRPERPERVLRRHPGPDRPQHGRPVDRLAGRRRPRDGPRHRRPHARAASPAAAPRSSSPTSFGAADRVVRQRAAPYDPPDFLVGEEINLVGSGPIRNMYNPSARRRPQLLLAARSRGTEVHAAAGPGNHWFYLLAAGHQPDQRPADQPDLQQHHGHRPRHPERRSRSCTTRC